MKRRTLLTGIGASFALMLAGSKTPTLAQERPQFKLEYEGQIAKASRDFEVDSLRFDGAMRYDFSVVELENEEHAKQAFKRNSEDFIREYTAFSGLPIVEDLEVKVPDDLAEDVVGRRLNTKSGEVDAVISFVFMREGEFVYVHGGVGLVDSTIELVDILNKQRERIAEATPEPGALFDLLPALEDMPVGFAMTKEDFED